MFNETTWIRLIFCFGIHVKNRSMHHSILFQNKIWTLWIFEKISISNFSYSFIYYYSWFSFLFIFVTYKILNIIYNQIPFEVSNVLLSKTYDQNTKSPFYAKFNIEELNLCHTFAWCSRKNAAVFTEGKYINFLNIAFFNKYIFIQRNILPQSIFIEQWCQGCQEKFWDASRMNIILNKLCRMYLY